MFFFFLFFNLSNKIIQGNTDPICRRRRNKTTIPHVFAFSKIQGTEWHTKKNGQAVYFQTGDKTTTRQIKNVSLTHALVLMWPWIVFFYICLDTHQILSCDIISTNQRNVLCLLHFVFCFFFCGDVIHKPASEIASICVSLVFVTS